MNICKKIAAAAVFTALALLAFMLENLFPPLPVPGAKLGLANLFTLLALLLLGGGYALATVLARCILGSLFIGNFSSLMYSLPAGLIALAFEYVLLNFAFAKISVVAASVGAAALHNAVQNAVFCLAAAPEAIIYLPYLTLVGVIAGLAVGLAVFTVIRLMPQKYLTAFTGK